MGTIAVGCWALTGYGRTARAAPCWSFCPLALSIAFSLIADGDNPRHGMIRVRPET
jgi:hypothetical protein